MPMRKTNVVKAHPACKIFLWVFCPKEPLPRNGTHCPCGTVRLAGIFLQLA